MRENAALSVMEKDTLTEMESNEVLSATDKVVEAAILAEKLKYKNRKQAIIRIMASHIYGHLHGDGHKSLIVKGELVSDSVKAALAIWQEVEEQVT